MAVIDERVNQLEVTLARFIEQTSVVLAAIHEEVAEIRASNARTDRQLLQMQQQADKDRKAAEKDRQELKEFNARNERDHKEFNARNEKDHKEFNARNEKDHKELNERYEKDHKALNERYEKDRKEFNERYEKERKEFSERYEKDRKEFNKRMAEISESMGTLIEDMVAPCSFQLAHGVFESEEAETCAIRVKRRNPQNRGEMMEIDLLATGPTKLLVVEVKRRADPAKIVEYRQKLARLPEFFPELASKTVLGAVASVYLEPSIIAYLNREKLYGIALGDEVMQVVNLGQF